MNKSRLAALIWVLIYGGLITVCVSIFVLRTEAEGLGWWMLAVGTASSVSGAALVVVRARMEDPVSARTGRRR